MGEVESVEARALAMRDAAGAVVVRSDGDFERAADFLSGVVALKAEINAAFAPLVEAAHLAHKAATSQRAKALAPVEEAETAVRKALAAYQAEQEMARVALLAEEERRLSAERAALEAQAEALEEEGAHAAARSLAIAAAKVQPEPLRATPKQEGLSFRESWRFEVENLDQVPREYLRPDERKIGAAVAAFKGETKIPGVRVWGEKVVVVRGGRA
jgi:hypothetical protein